MGGRDWYSWVGTRKSSSKKEGHGHGGGGSGTRRASSINTTGGSGAKEEKEACSSSSSTASFSYPSSTTFSASTATPAGCMSAVFNLFDFQFCLPQQQTNAFHQPSSFLGHEAHDPPSTSSIKGVEAPRNSLENEEMMVNGTLSSITEEDLEEQDHENFNIPMGIQIETNNNSNGGIRRDTSLLRIHTTSCSSKSKRDDSLSAAAGRSSASCSPGGARTPTLVARLMGLDLLPQVEGEGEAGSTPTINYSSAPSNDTTPRSSSPSSLSHPQRRLQNRNKTTTCPSSPDQKNQQMSTPLPPTPIPTSSSSSSKKDKKNNKLSSYSAGTQPLPEAQRISLARKSDVADYRPLAIGRQISKENNIHQEFELSRHSCSAINTKNKRTDKLRVQARGEDHSETKSPRHYARQILKQVKESVTRRRFGLDITNTSTVDVGVGGQSSKGDHRRDQNLLMQQHNTNKSPPKEDNAMVKFLNNDHSIAAATAGKISNLPSTAGPFSRSPRLRFLEPKTKSTTAAKPAAATPGLDDKHPQKPPKGPSPSPSSTISIHNNHHNFDTKSSSHQTESILQPAAASQPPPPPSLLLSQTDQGLRQKPSPELAPTPKKVMNVVHVHNHYRQHPRFASHSRVKKPTHQQPHSIHDTINRNKTEEQFVHTSSIVLNRAAPNYCPDPKKCRKTALSSDLLHVSVPSFVPVLKKDSSPSPSPTKLLLHGQKSQEEPWSVKAAAAAQPSKSTTAQLSSSYNNLFPYENKQAWTPVVVQRKKKITEDESADADADADAATTTSARGSCGLDEFHQYVSGILKCTGIEKYTPVVPSFTRWYSLSHPLDPSIFHDLEHTTYNNTDNYNSHYNPTTILNNHYNDKNNTTSISSSAPLGLRCNRKLIFHLVDEILGDILKPYLNLKPWMSSHCSYSTTRTGHGEGDKKQLMYGFQLVKTLCTKITSFPSAHCEVLQDIDELIDKDLLGVQQTLNGASEEEGEGIVIEIERDIVDLLVHELCHGC